MRKWIVVAAIVAALVAIYNVTPLAADQNTWEVDSVHSGAYFAVRHLGIINVHGSFTKMTGTVSLDDQDISKSSVNATIDVSSVFTGVDARDKHLQAPDFFDVAKYPTMTFQSTKMTKTGNGIAKMTGNLTIHGITKEVTFDVTGPSAPITAMNATRRGISATTTINRQDFGVTSDMTVGDQVSIDLEIDMAKK